MFILLTEVLLSLAISLVILSLLNGVSTPLFTDLCGTRERAAFWYRFNQSMLLCTPLLTVLFLNGDGETLAAYSAPELRETLRHALLGSFVSLLVIGLVIWKSIPLAAARDTAIPGKSNHED